jgi:hypothetical protein
MRVRLDAVVIPSLLLLVARDLVLQQPTRVLAWRALHDDRLGSLAGLLLPGPPPDLDRDPVALALAALLASVALAYLLAEVSGAGRRVRWGLLAAGALFAVALPTVAFVAMGQATGRPYGQDGGVVQLPLAIDRLLAGRSPYGADYSDSLLGKQARVSDFWETWGGNPILHHHAYLPGTHLLMLPFHLASKALLGSFDPRLVTLLAWVLAGLLAALLVEGDERKLCAAALVWVNPLVYWHQVFGANDVLLVALLLGCAWLGPRRPLAAAAVLGLACATKQLAWPFAPFLLVWLSGARTPRELPRVLRPALLAGAVALAVVLPVIALDPARFYQDIVAYNVGLPGTDAYPLGGTPGFGFANVLIYRGAVASLRDHVSFAPFYALLIPLGLALLWRQLREGGFACALACGSLALVASLYVSRVVHPNYLLLAAVLLPLALLAGARLAVDVVVAPLCLFAMAVELCESEMMRGIWQQAVEARWPQGLGRGLSWLLPAARPDLTHDPLGLALAALAAGAAVVYLACGLLGAPARVRSTVVVLSATCVAVPATFVMVDVGARTGVLRAQEPWFASVAGESGVPVREAWSQSFRREPPALVPAAQPSLLGRLGIVDPRPWLLAVLALAAFLIARSAPAEQRPLALAAALLAPGLLLGTLAGAATAAALLGLVLLGTRFGPALLVLLPPWEPRAVAAGFGLAGGSRWRMVLAGLALAWAAINLAAPSGAHAGLGVSNLLLYAGVVPGAAWSVAGLLTAAALAWLLRGRDGLAPVALLAAVVLTAGSSPQLAGVVAALLILPVLQRGEDPGGDVSR